MAQILELYFDESGSPLPDHKERKSPSERPDFFAFGGILIQATDVRGAWEQHRRFCQSWSINYPLHSHEIRNRRGRFRWLRHIKPEDRRRFFDGLRQLIVDLRFSIVACVIDRPGYNARYEDRYGKDRWRLCKTAFAIMVERAAKFADRCGCQLTVHYEGAGQEEDRAKETYLKDLKKNGMPFDTSSSGKCLPLTASDFRRIVLGDPHRTDKEVPICQIADLVLHPVAIAGYRPQHEPYGFLKEKGKLIDCVMKAEEIPLLGIKYSCFPESKNEKLGG
jgi:uncharacterized protein DUF3800